MYKTSIPRRFSAGLFHLTMSAPKIIVLVRLKLQSELYWAFSEIVRRFQAESAAAKGDLALAQRAGETANGRQTGLVASISSGARILGEPGQQCRLPRERTMSGN
jgi:hypothetical protein